MKYFSALLPLFLLFSGLSEAQQIRQYTQYMYNQYGHNPAVAGSKDCNDFKLGYRNQWVGFEGAPKTGFASFQTRLKHKKRPLSGGYHGIGLYMENDVMGPFTTTYIYPSYAYHVKINHDYMLSAGVFAGIQQNVFDSNLRLYNPNDPAIGGTQSIFIFPDITGGLWLYSKDLYAGLAAGQVIGNRKKGIFGGEIGTESRLARHYNLTVGRRWKAGKNYSLIPSVMFKLLPGATPAVDLNLLADFRNLMSVGLSYRNTDALAALLRFRLLPFMDMGYSFDLTTSRIRTGSSNTHEFWIGLRFCGKGGGERYERNFICPAYN
jgi:type IX secretion system PorP/SprF family membrane protein